MRCSIEILPKITQLAQDSFDASQNISNFNNNNNFTSVAYSVYQRANEKWIAIVFGCNACIAPVKLDSDAFKVILLLNSFNSADFQALNRQKS